ncbi:hypothetical protein GE21DRAFT_1776 [Neurospora crassa]|uniref:Uncharacterized protein n=2 Tax=Neurospora crassa TaxID=5141 RepID=Q7SFC5_NEUCR|nr:hypothetical protein NCU00922 [Neurospora crassa OR74A]EAA35512.1 hypothetical protein NCU00922 [Neurospora crassa OR74A]KHE81813.1 hypothetical protein GE21DRAFT_1776 [Neurospora crassa]CAE76582.1 hypothetical protein [Neurospora crassa]|eukprot:XP_964748.1 hypothetical protein NCU00922 [Neurospora crassa OR74A]
MPGDNGTHGQTAFHFHVHPFLAVVVAGPAGRQKYDRCVGLLSRAGAIWQNMRWPCDRRASGDPRCPSELCQCSPAKASPPAIALENEDAVAVVVGRPLRAGLAKTSLTSTLGMRDNF